MRLGHFTLRDALKRFGRPTRTVHYGTYSVKTVFERHHLSVYYCARDLRKRIFSMDFTSGSRVETPTRIHIGSTVGQVIDSYGDAAWASVEGSPYCELDYSGVQFYVKRGKRECPGIGLEDLIVEISVVERRSMDCDKLYPAPKR